MAVNRLWDGDYRPNGTGAFQQARGAEEVLERVLFKLSARRGSFPLLPEVGSRLYLLLRAKESARETLGAAYAAEALESEPDLAVTGTAWNQEGEELTVFLDWRGEPLEAAVKIRDP